MAKTHGERLSVIENNLDGNGREGYYQKVDKHEKFFQRFKGALALITFVGISNIALIIIFIFRWGKGFEK